VWPPIRFHASREKIRIVVTTKNVKNAVAKAKQQAGEQSKAFQWKPSTVPEPGVGFVKDA